MIGWPGFLRSRLSACHGLLHVSGPHASLISNPLLIDSGFVLWPLPSFRCLGVPCQCAGLPLWWTGCAVTSSPLLGYNLGLWPAFQAHGVWCYFGVKLLSDQKAKVIQIVEDHKEKEYIKEYKSSTISSRGGSACQRTQRAQTFAVVPCLWCLFERCRFNTWFHFPVAALACMHWAVRQPGGHVRVCIPQYACCSQVCVSFLPLCLILFEVYWFSYSETFWGLTSNWNVKLMMNWGNQ